MASTEPRTLLLFCPYDKKVTRHARRGSKMQMVCMDCGRGVEDDPAEPASVKTPNNARRERTIGSPPEIPDLAEILAGSFSDASSVRARRPQSTRAATAPVPRRSAPESLRRAAPSRGSADWKVHPALLVAAAFFCALALANVLGNLLGGQPNDVKVASEAPSAAARIVNTDGQGVYIRQTPNFEDRLSTAIPEGGSVRVIGVETVVQGIPWRQVQDPDGVRGWLPSQYLAIEGIP